MAEEKYLMYNRNGGTIMFKAKNIEEATEIANNNLVAKASANKYEHLKMDYIINNIQEMKLINSPSEFLI